MENTKEKKIMTKTVSISVSKAGNPYLNIEGKNQKRYFVNLIKENKAFTPTIPYGSKEVEVHFTSFSYDDENSRLALFGVSELIFKK